MKSIRAVIFVVLVVQARMVAAEGEEASFSFDTGILEIPIVQVDSGPYFSANLMLFDIDTLSFQLSEASEIFPLDSASNLAHFDGNLGVLRLPVVNVSGSQFEVEMSLLPESETLSFMVSSAVEISGKPSTLPAFDSINLYSTESVFNQPIESNPEIDVNSDTYIETLGNLGQFVVQVKQFSAPVFFADENTPRTNVMIECGSTWELGINQLNSVPIPDFAEPANDVDGAANPPIGCGEESDQDNHMIVLDTVNRCEYDLWQARNSGGSWSASWATAISMDSSGVYPGGMSTRGSGFAFLGGMIWPDELASGEIKHMLGFNAPLTRSGGPVYPATDTDGHVSDASVLPEGAIIQLNPELDLDSLNLTSYELTIAKAMQTYGMVLLDTGGATNMGLYVIDPRSAQGNIYQSILPDEDFVLLSNIAVTPENFRVLALPDQDADWQQSLSFASNACAEFE